MNPMMKSASLAITALAAALLLPACTTVVNPDTEPTTTTSTYTQSSEIGVPTTTSTQTRTTRRY